MKRRTNFYYSFLALPAEERKAIVAVWDFCRAVDDAVDEAEPVERTSIERALDEWRAEVGRLFAGEEPRTLQGRGLAPHVARFGLTRQPFDDLIDGVATDIDAPRFASFDDLRLYCYRVASTVGLTCLRIFGVEGAGARRYAEHLGIALQLTNILRDLPADLARRRLYVPLDEMARYGCTEADLRTGKVVGGVRELLAHQAARARQYYELASAQCPPDQRRKLVAAEIMRGIYRELLRRIEARDFDVFSPPTPVGVSRPRKLAIALGTWARVRVGR